MTLAQDFEDFVKLLNRHQVDYMVVGGYALAFHGKPRHTGDLDIWINSSETNAEKLVIAIKEFNWNGGKLNKYQFLNLIQDHQTHHVGQLIVYLRINNIEPPKYIGW